MFSTASRRPAADVWSAAPGQRCGLGSSCQTAPWVVSRWRHGLKVCRFDTACRLLLVVSVDFMRRMSGSSSFTQHQLMCFSYTMITSAREILPSTSRDVPLLGAWSVCVTSSKNFPQSEENWSGNSFPPGESVDLKTAHVSLTKCPFGWMKTWWIVCTYQALTHSLTLRHREFDHELFIMSQEERRLTHLPHSAARLSHAALILENKQCGIHRDTHLWAIMTHMGLGGDEVLSWIP